jgi:hypothetical protein
MKKVFNFVCLLLIFAPSVAFSQEVIMVKKSKRGRDGSDRSRYERIIAYQDSVSSEIAASIMNRRSGSITNKNDPQGMQIRLIKRN